MKEEEKETQVAVAEIAPYNNFRSISSNNY